MSTHILGWLFERQLAGKRHLEVAVWKCPKVRKNEGIQGQFIPSLPQAFFGQQPLDPQIPRYDRRKFAFEQAHRREGRHMRISGQAQARKP